jgi:hypothetical protein
MEGNRCDGRHRCGRGTREWRRMRIVGVVHRHNTVHRVGPDSVLNLSMSINGIPAIGARGGGEQRVSQS